MIELLISLGTVLLLKKERIGLSRGFFPFGEAKHRPKPFYFLGVSVIGELIPENLFFLLFEEIHAVLGLEEEILIAIF